MPTRPRVRYPGFLFLPILLASPVHAQGETSVRFGMVTDVHYADREALGSRFYRESAAKLTEFAAAMNREKVDFVIELGDYKDQDSPPDPERTIGYLRAVERIFSVFSGPRFHVLGNHDADSLSKREFLGAVINSGIPADRSFYSFDRGGLHFVVLDANFRSDGRDYERGNFEWTDANIPASEMRWLADDLAGGGSPTVVFVHQQLDGEGSYSVKNAGRVRELLEHSGRVLAVFQGHRHEGAYSLLNGIHYYTLKGMIEGSGESSSAYAIVEVDRSGDIRVRGFRQASAARLERGGPRSGIDSGRRPVDPGGRNAADPGVR